MSKLTPALVDKVRQSLQVIMTSADLRDTKGVLHFTDEESAMIVKHAEKINTLLTEAALKEDRT